MNFLSHYYFDRNDSNCYHILGIVLPDLLKNADKTLVLHPEKLHTSNNAVNSIVTGWNKHLEVDRYFHSSDFFLEHSHELKKRLLPAVVGSPVKPFFLGHIALELILDNLLITTHKITVHSFYEHLQGCNDAVIEEFLLAAGMKNPPVFFRFFTRFKDEKYLHTYVETLKIAYALKRVCMRVWKDPFTEAHEQAMNVVLEQYRGTLMPSFMQVFEEIESKLRA